MTTLSVATVTCLRFSLPSPCSRHTIFYRKSFSICYPPRSPRWAVSFMLILRSRLLWVMKHCCLSRLEARPDEWGCWEVYIVRHAHTHTHARARTYIHTPRLDSPTWFFFSFRGCSGLLALVCSSSAGVASGGGERRITRCHAPDNRYRQTNICCPVCLARRAFVARYVDWSFPHQRSRCFASLENIGLISFHVTELCVRNLDESLWSMFWLDSVYFR